MKIQFISDTHGRHRDVEIGDVDMVIHAGDHSNYYDLIPNYKEYLDFVDWFSELPIKHKIMIAGNHDASLTEKYNKDFLKLKGITYLEDEYKEIEGLKILGSPWSPNFNDWHFMKSRQKLGKFWDNLLEEDIDILITHTPPKGILDLSLDRDNNLEFCGCNGLRKAVEKYKPKVHVFGHIHSNSRITNHGIRVVDKTTFINASVVDDGNFDDVRNGIVYDTNQCRN